MPSFKIDLSKAIQEKQNLNLKLNKYFSVCSDIFTYTKASKNVWNDPASYGFNKIVLKDESETNEVVKNLREYYDNLDLFTEELSDLYIKRDFDINNLVIDYNSEYMYLAISSLTTILGILNNTIDVSSSHGCPRDFNYYREIDNISSDLMNIKREFKDLFIDFNELYTRTSTILEKSNNKHKSIEYATINGGPTRFEWSLVSTLKQKEVELKGANKVEIKSNIIESNKIENQELDEITKYEIENNPNQTN